MPRLLVLYKYWKLQGFGKVSINAFMGRVVGMRRAASENTPSVNTLACLCVIQIMTAAVALYLYGQILHGKDFVSPKSLEFAPYCLTRPAEG